MKRLTIALALFAMLSFTAQAQHSSADRAERRTQEIAKAANLTPQQYTQIKQIFLDAFTKVDALGKDRSQLDAVRTQRQAIMKDANAKVNAVLTDDQKTAVRQAAKNKRSEQPQRQGDRPRHN